MRLVDVLSLKVGCDCVRLADVLCLTWDGVIV